jgi:microcin C transport system ATP-binding protein
MHVLHAPSHPYTQSLLASSMIAPVSDIQEKIA